MPTLPIVPITTTLPDLSERGPAIAEPPVHGRSHSKDAEHSSAFQGLLTALAVPPAIDLRLPTADALPVDPGADIPNLPDPNIVLDSSVLPIIVKQTTIRTTAVMPINEASTAEHKAGEDAQTATSLPVPDPRFALANVAVASAKPSTPPSPAVNGATAYQLAHDILEQAAFVVGHGRTDIHMQLRPPELGSIQVHLSTTDQAVTARLVVTSEATQRQLENGWQTLQLSLADAGVRLVSFEVMKQDSVPDRAEAGVLVGEVDELGLPSPRSRATSLIRRRGLLDLLA